MAEYVIHNDFFKQNPLKKISAAAISDFKLTTQYADELQAEIERVVLKGDKAPARRSKYEDDKNMIATMDSGEAIVKFMRQEHDGLTDSALCKKALTMESETVPLIMKRYMTSGQDRFIELSFQILAQADIQYTEQLFADYKSIRNPYAQAVACLLFGERGMEDAPPLLMEEYRRFQRDYPDEGFDQHPLLALYILYGVT